MRSYLSASVENWNFTRSKSLKAAATGALEKIFNQIAEKFMDRSPKKKNIFLVFLALAVGVLLVFGQMYHHEFISFDDHDYIVENSHVNTGLRCDNIVWAFSKIHAFNWHPVTWMSHMLDCELYGLKAGGHHFTSILFHLANAFLLLVVFKLMTRRFWPSFFVAAAFALHPLHVQSVAWAAERKDVLSTFFWMLTMWAYICYVNRPGIKRYLLAFFVFGVGLMAKQMLVTLPFVLLLLDHWPLNRFKAKSQSTGSVEDFSASNKTLRLILEKIPFLVLSVIASVMIFLVQQRTGVMRSTIDHPLPHRLSNAFVSYIVYIQKMFWPSNLAVFYPHPGGNLPARQVVMSILLLTGVTAVVFWKVRTKPYLTVGWLWYLVTLLPVIGLVQVGDQAYADRYSYVPLTGLFIMAAFGLPEIFGRLRYHKEILSFSAAAILCVLGFLSWGQVKHWRDNLALYRRATTVVKDNWWAHYNLGVVLGEQGKFDEAISHYRETIRLRANYVRPYSALAMTLLWKGELDEAIVNFRKALQMKPDQPEVHVDFGIALARQRKLKEGKEHFSEALRYNPNLAEAHYNLGYALGIEGDLDGAIEHYNQALRAKSNFINARIQLANVLARQNKIALAIETAEAALKLSENSGQKEFVEKIRNQLKAYRSRKPGQKPSIP